MVTDATAEYGRYEDLGLLGVGGMGEVRRVRDPDLKRVMAMKIIREDLSQHPAILARFLEEAQCSAQLQHPGIVPVHELGRLPDGRAYFTMREVRGKSFNTFIEEVHQASDGRGWGAGPSGWTFRRLVDAFVQVCEAVGYAHARGVVHRDLKPENVMVGEHGEVLVVDWGLAKVRGARDRAAEAGDLDTVVTSRSSEGQARTRMGAVAGTPAYMPPEQARGEIDRIDARSDVYALGAVLYELLAGRPPYEGTSGHAVLRLVLAGPPAPPDQSIASAFDTWSFGAEALERPPRSGPPVPEELVTACLRAMAREPEERYAHAAELAAEVGAWLEGSRRREQALACVAQAAALAPQVFAVRAAAARLRAEAEAMLAEVPSWESEAKKAPAWVRQEEADALERRADALEVEAEQRLVGALQVDPSTPEAHAALAERHGAAHAAAEAARDSAAIVREETLLRAHAALAPREDSQRWAAYLRGHGALTLVTDPPGADVDLYRYEVRNRRLLPVPVRTLGRTPLRAVALAMGSYLCILRRPGRQDVRFPVSIGRGEHWDGVAPSDAEPFPIYLPSVDELGPDDCYIAAGWFRAGGDEGAQEPLAARRLWCDGLVMRRFPVTNREYITFLDDLVSRGRVADALAWAPRERSGALGEEGALCYGRDGRGRFVLVPDAEGDVWSPEWPVINVHFGCALAYTRWSADRSGLAWRLPAELEWEKAARGTDGRFFPWGDALDPSWSCWRDSHPGRPLPAPVNSFPVDESVYGVRGLSGNVQDWCGDAYVRAGEALVDQRVTVPRPPAEVDLSTAAPRRSGRGGHWVGTARFARPCSRFGSEPSNRLSLVGFRMARSIGG